MRFLKVLIFTILATKFASADIPVFMSTESRFASGILPIEKLGTNRLDSKSQEWAKVTWKTTETSKTGWVLKRHLKSVPDSSDWSVTVPNQLAVRILPQMNADIIEILPKLTPVQSIQNVIIKWNLSWTKEHGSVWWNNKEELPEPIEINKPKILSSEEIFKREIYDMASHPHNENIKIVSAKGVFLTRDNQSWQKIAFFENQNLPVIFSANGTLFVGQYKSEDVGKNFTFTFKWDVIASKVIQHLKKSPHTIRLLSYEPHPENSQHLLMQLNIGYKKRVKLFSEDDGLNWEVYHTPAAFSLLQNPVTYTDLQR